MFGLHDHRRRTGIRMRGACWRAGCYLTVFVLIILIVGPGSENPAPAVAATITLNARTSRSTVASLRIT